MGNLRYHVYLFKWFPTSQRFILKLNKKVKSLGVPGFGV